MTAAEILSLAAFFEQKHAQAVPSFGSERMGAPVVSFCRIDDGVIRLREPITEPDALIIQDPTLFHALDVFAGLTPRGFVLVNSSRSIEQLGIGQAVGALPRGHARCVPATELALKHVGKPVPNAALLGALAAETGVVELTHVLEAIRHKFPGRMGEANVAAATAAYEAATATA